MNPLANMMGGSMPGGGIGNIMTIANMLKGKDPNAVAQLLAQRNPQFKQFMQQCQGKTPEQIAQQYGIDLNQIRQLMG